MRARIGKHVEVLAEALVVDARSAPENLKYCGKRRVLPSPERSKLAYRRSAVCDDKALARFQALALSYRFVC
jgi:hypothetical protein